MDSAKQFQIMIDEVGYENLSQEIVGKYVFFLKLSAFCHQTLSDAPQSNPKSMYAFSNTTPLDKLNNFCVNQSDILFAAVADTTDGYFCVSSFLFSSSCSCA